MRCPVCKCSQSSISKARGFSKELINECSKCNTVWYNDEKYEIHIIHKGEIKEALLYTT